MVALLEKLPSRSSPESQRTRDSLILRVIPALTKAALNTFGEKLGSPGGRHALHDDNYHHSAQRYIEEAASETQYRPFKSRSRDPITVAQLQRKNEIAKVDINKIAQDPRYLLTHPHQQFLHEPPDRRS